MKVKDIVVSLAMFYRESSAYRIAGTNFIFFLSILSQLFIAFVIVAWTFYGIEYWLKALVFFMGGVMPLHYIFVIRSLIKGKNHN